MVTLLQTIASNQEKMNKYLAEASISVPNSSYFDNATGNNYGGNHNARNINYNPSVPATQGLERKAYSNPDMNKQHAKNIKIANPGSV